MKHHCRIKYLTIIVLLSFAFGSSTVYANAPQPPNVIRFNFDYQMSHSVNLEGLQLVSCQTDQCDQAGLLQQYGHCNSSSCLSSSPTLTQWPSSLECVGHRCRSAASSSMCNNLYFKIIAQFSDKTRTSKVIDRLPVYAMGKQVYYKVIVNDRMLLVVKSDIQPTGRQSNQFWIAFALTQLSEVVVGLLYFLCRLRIAPKELPKSLLLILLINLATFPVVWLFFPILEHFAPRASRLAGVGVLLLASCYAFALLSIYRASNKTQRLQRVMVAIVGFLLVTTVFCLYLFTVLYGNSNSVFVVGISFVATVILAEIFAVVVEAILLCLSTKGELSLRHAGELSFTMNMVSLLLGLWVLQGW